MNAIAACYSVECERYPLLFVTVRGDLLTCASGKRVGCGYLLSRLPAVCFANRWHRNYSHGPNRADEDREEDYRVLVCCILEVSVCAAEGREERRHFGPCSVENGRDNLS